MSIDTGTTGRGMGLCPEQSDAERAAMFGRLAMDAPESYDHGDDDHRSGGLLTVALIAIGATVAVIAAAVVVLL